MQAPPASSRSRRCSSLELVRPRIQHPRLPERAPSADPTTGNYTQAFQGGTDVTGGSESPPPPTPWLLSSPVARRLDAGKSCTLRAAPATRRSNGWIVQGPTGVFAVPTAVRQSGAGTAASTTSSGSPRARRPPTRPPATTPRPSKAGRSRHRWCPLSPRPPTPGSRSVYHQSPWLGASTQAKSCTLKGGACYQAFQTAGSCKAPPGVFAVPTVRCSRAGAGTAGSTTCWGSPAAPRRPIRPPATTPRPSRAGPSPSPAESADRLRAPRTGYLSSQSVKSKSGLSSTGVELAQYVELFGIDGSPE